MHCRRRDDSEQLELLARIGRGWLLWYGRTSHQASDLSSRVVRELLVEGRGILRMDGTKCYKSSKLGMIVQFKLQRGQPMSPARADHVPEVTIIFHGGGGSQFVDERIGRRFHRVKRDA